MATYDLDKVAVDTALTHLLSTSSISSALVTLLDGKSALTGQLFETTMPTASDITAGTDVVIVKSSGTIDLSHLSTANNAHIKDLNLLVFDTNSSVNVTLNDSFKGTVVLGDGADTLVYNGVQRIAVIAGDGNDSITLGDGHDTVTVGNGNDTITVGNGNDTIILGTGPVDGATGPGTYLVNTGNGNNLIIAHAGNATINTGNGTDTIEVSSGNDSINTGNGNDLVIVKEHLNNSVFTSTIYIDGGNGMDTLDLAAVTIDPLSGLSYNPGSPHHVTINLTNGTTLDVNNVEKFVIDLDGNNQADTGETVLLTGLLNILSI